MRKICFFFVCVFLVGCSAAYQETAKACLHKTDCQDVTSYSGEVGTSYERFEIKEAVLKNGKKLIFHSCVWNDAESVYFCKETGSQEEWLFRFPKSAKISWKVDPIKK